ncbi:methylamine dehydrogenase (amicyanin) light chain [Novosphingobium sp. 1949]|uniref:Methylamine dehydrogenase (amicyanin) n=1 Tax=Novosphingobium organovorum TaxID=2930092 RepID=A0ABT0BAX1_9SPHN|nr:methylamine dehydrogenase light chain [Novosphingobium organovorum]MCJ2182153.1 methylamine dehydrogenase (amicyanin) light chain [Novosphingobium organovorum]
MGDSKIDKLGEAVLRGIARRSSRRGFLGKLGVAMAAGSAFPLLPVSRASGAPAPTPSAPLSDFERNAQSSDPLRCDYWRHCAIDGTICGCCGGGLHTCPPGSTPSPTAWVGTCLNPDDGRSYLIAYRDCCGTSACVASGEDCECTGTDRELPIYRPQANNDIIWCFGDSSMAYHCSTAALVGLAE